MHDHQEPLAVSYVSLFLSWEFRCRPWIVWSSLTIDDVSVTPVWDISCLIRAQSSRNRPIHAQLVMPLKEVDRSHTSVWCHLCNEVEIIFSWIMIADDCGLTAFFIKWTCIMETVPACLFCGSTEQISVKFDTVSLYKKLSGQFNFGLHWLNINPCFVVSSSHILSVFLENT